MSILEFLHGRVLSPNRIANGLERPLGNVVYHVNVLVKVGALEFVRKQRRRGAWEHYYVASPHAMIGDQAWRQAPLAVRPGVTNEAVRHFLGRLVDAMDAGTIDRRDDSTLNWMPLTLDERGWLETSELLRRTRDILAGIHDRSRARLGDTDGIPVVAGLAAFEAAPFQARKQSG